MSSDRLVELLLKGVRALPDAERDEVLAALLSGAVGGGPGHGGAEVGGELSGDVGTSVRPEAQLLRARVISGGWIRPAERPATSSGLAGLLGAGPGAGASTGAAGGTGADADLRVLPVRLPAVDHDRLRAFSREHGFSMAVIIRTLVERFLDGQARRWARPADGPDDEDLDEPTTAGHA